MRGNRTRMSPCCEQRVAASEKIPSSMQQPDPGHHPKARGRYDHEKSRYQEGSKAQIFEVNRKKRRNRDGSKKRRQITKWKERQKSHKQEASYCYRTLQSPQSGQKGAKEEMKNLYLAEEAFDSEIWISCALTARARMPTVRSYATVEKTS